MFRKWFLRICIVGLIIVLVTIFHPVSHSLAQSKEPVVLKSWLVNFADCIEIWRQLSEDLKKIGIQVELKTGTISEYVGEIIKKPKDHPYHLVTMVWGAGPARLEPSFYLMELFHSERAKPGGRNYCSYINQEYDRVVDAQLKETDRNKRQKLIWEVQEIIHRTDAFFPIFHRDYIQAYNVERIKNVVPVMGTGVGFPYIPWTFLKAEPVGKIREPRIVGKNDLITLNPFAVSQVQNESWLRLCYDTFVMRDQETNLIPWAAESWNIVDDTTVDIVLRKGMAFHDGKPVTVDDVKFTFDYILKWKFPALSHVWRNIDSVEVLQNKNVRFKLKHPYAPFVANILLKAFVAPKHIWEKIPESVNVTNPQEWNNPKPVGSGPYKFDVWKKGEYFHLIANKKHRMAPKFDGLYYIQVPSVENQMAMLEKKQAEILGWFVDKKQGDKLDSFPHLKMVAVPGHGIHEIRPNCKLKPTSDPQFRKAFQSLVNRRQMLEVTYEGFGTLCHNTPITPKLKFWNNPNIPIIEFDINKAKEILKAAGYTWDEQGRLCYP